MSNDIFNDLGDLGFNNITNINLYGNNKPNDVKMASKGANAAVSNFFEKTVSCPVCRRESKITMAKKHAAKISKKDTDFMVYFSGVNLMFYEVEYCPECGYAALVNNFNSITNRQAEMIREKISVNWKPKNFGEIKDVDTAIQLFKLALLNCVVKEGKASEKALICLKLSWLYRLKEDEQMEHEFQQKALDGLNLAYENEYFPIIGLDKWNLLYLIGELNRRLGKNDVASRYFSEVLVSKCSPALKERIRDVKELMS